MKKTKLGRPRIDKEPQVPKTVCLSPVRWKEVKRLGNGNYSAGLRELLDSHTLLGERRRKARV